MTTGKGIYKVIPLSPRIIVMPSYLLPCTNLDSSSTDIFTVITLDGPINLVLNVTLKLV